MRKRRTARIAVRIRVFFRALEIFFFFFRGTVFFGSTFAVLVGAVPFAGAGRGPVAVAGFALGAPGFRAWEGAFCFAGAEAACLLPDACFGCELTGAAGFLMPVDATGFFTPAVAAGCFTEPAALGAAAGVDGFLTTGSAGRISVSFDLNSPSDRFFRGAT